MARPSAKHRYRLPRLVNLHARLFISAAIAAAVIAALYLAWPDLRLATKLLVGWDIGVAAYLAMTFQMMASADLARIRGRAAEHDEGAFALLVLPVAAAVASLLAIFSELSLAKVSDTPGPHSALAIVTIALSWTFIHTLFALHYAHDFYGEGERANGLQFPGKDKPDYWDFAYFSFVVGTTFQVSDVAITNRLIRRQVWAHGVLSFAFNTAILAVTVNLATNAI
jgi:uncharacterized membrane protein